MTITSFEDLEIWKEAREMAKIIRALSQNEKFRRDYRFCAQINTAAGSTMDNIAEGFERDGNKEFIQFLYIAKGSNGEVRSQSYRAFDAEFISNKELQDLLQRTGKIRKMINGFILYLRNSDNKGNKFAKTMT